MAIRKVLTIPDDNDFLRKKSRDVTMIDDRILTLLDDMKETLYAENGVGLAAPQVGILRRVVVIDVGEGLIELINPVIVYKKGEQIKVRVRAIDRNNKEFTIEGEGLLAIALCHEIDHLNGTLYVDKMIAEVEN